MSGITKQEAVDHPAAVLAALNFHMQGPTHTKGAPLPTRAAVEQQMAKVRGGGGERRRRGGERRGREEGERGRKRSEQTGARMLWRLSNGVAII